MENELKEKQLIELIGRRFLPRKAGENAVEFVYLSGIAHLIAE